MKTFNVLKAVTIDGTDHVVGATVELPEGKAAHWVEDGTLELVEKMG